MKTASSATCHVLPSGKAMPLHGFGTWKSTASETKAAVTAALEAGYTHIDCAPVYMNEAYVGEALSTHLSATSRPRSDLFITSKVWNTCHGKDDVVAACRQSLKDLQLEYVDLYLIHHPFAWKHAGLPITEDNWVSRDADGEIEWATGISLEQTWRGMEEVQRLGLARDIGVSNYAVTPLMDLLQYATIKPAVNQCEAHVYNTRQELRQVCDKFGVHFTMYSILGSGKQGPLEDDTVKRIADELGASTAQVCIAWGAAQGCSVLAKTARVERAAHNLAAKHVLLSNDHVRLLDALDRKLLVCNMAEYWGFASHA